MPRTLPWLAASGKVKQEANSPAPETKRTKNPRVKDETPSKKEPLTPRKDFLRSSPSPPTSPIHRCPSEEFLQEGLDKDDIYMMVEDEFYAVAQTFTQHLHYAEFVRLKKEAKLKNAATIADIARPTNGVTAQSAALKKKTAAEELKMRQKEGVDAALGRQADGQEQEQEQDANGEEGDELDNDDAWAGTHLQNFILSPRRVRSLVGMQGVRSSTRAAAGFAQASSDSRTGSGRSGGPLDGLLEERQKELTPPGETTDDDDLDAGVQQTSPTAGRRSYRPAEPQPLRHSSSASRTVDSVHTTREKKPDAGVRQPATTGRTTATSRSKYLDRQPSTMRRMTEKRHSEDLKKGEPITKPKEIPTKNTQGKRRLIFDDFDELPEPRQPIIQNEKRRPVSTNSHQKKPKEMDTGSKKSRLHEVPTFSI